VNVDWSTTGHGLPQEALRSSDNLRLPRREKARASRIAWERVLSGDEPYVLFSHKTGEAEA
jgi:hypothetical protein